MGITLVNNAHTTLSADASSTDTVIYVDDIDSFPTLDVGDYFYLTLERTSGAQEIVKVTQINAASFTVVRGQESTIPISFPIGSRAELRITVQGLEDQFSDVVGDVVDAAVIAAIPGLISDTAYGVSWDGVTAVAPSKNAIYDELSAIETSISALGSVISLRGTWDASAGTFPGSGTAKAGYSYIVSVAGTVDGRSFIAGDRIIAIINNASTTTYASNWFHADYTDAVSSVAGRTGAVTLTNTDISGLGALALASGVSTALIDDNAVTYAKMQDIANGLSVIGRTSNSGGDPQELVAGADAHVLRRSGTSLLFGTLSSGSYADGSVTLAKMATMATGSILGRATAATGNVEVLTTLPFAFTGDVTRAAGSNATVLAAGSAAVLNSGTLLAARMPALTGDVTTTVGTVATTVATSIITGRTQDTTPEALNDFVLTYDNSATALKKVLLKDLKTPECITIAVGDETTAITTGTAKVTWRMPYAFTVTAVRSSVNTVSSSGLPTVDINESGVSILSTTLSIDASEKTSTTAATAAVISDTSLADDAEMTIDIDTAGTGAKGLKVQILGYRT